MDAEEHAYARWQAEVRQRALNSETNNRMDPEVEDIVNTETPISGQVIARRVIVFNTDGTINETFSDNSVTEGSRATPIDLTTDEQLHPEPTFYMKYLEGEVSRLRYLSEQREKKIRELKKALAHKDSLIDRDSLELLIDNRCAICWATAANMVFEPCCHLACCDGCAQRVSACPLCRMPIGNKMKIYYA
jgi:hypothetical protein